MMASIDAWRFGGRHVGHGDREHRPIAYVSYRKEGSLWDPVKSSPAEVPGCGRGYNYGSMPVAHPPG